MPDVKVPLLGTIPKKGIILGVGGGALVVGYILYRRHQENAAASASASGYGYGSTAYGYGTGSSGYYGYGSEFQAYPSGDAYGYGAYGYGMYNPVTGQYYGPGSPPIVSPPPVIPPTTTPQTQPSKNKKPGTSIVTAQGSMDLYRIARMEGISLGRLLQLNPHLKRYEGTHKHIPRGVKVRV